MTIIEVDGLWESLPSIISTAIAMILLSALWLYVAKRSGIGELQKAVGRESDRLVDAQAKRIELLEAQVRELQIENARKDEVIARQERRIDALERLVTDEQIRKLLHAEEL